jgi:hypothetical protein
VGVRGMDWSTARKIESTLDEIKKIFGTGIIADENVGHPLFRAAFVQILILLRDIMAKAETLGKRISFEDHIDQNEKVKDVTDLIAYVRNALCHLESPNHLIDIDRKNTVSFCVAVGKGNLMQFGDILLSSEFEDDMRIFFGSQGIYMRRHIIRALNEASEFLLPLAKEAR